MSTLWDKVLERIATRMNPSSFQTWFAPTSQAAFEGKLLTIAVPDKYFVNWLEEQYRDSILEILHALTGQHVEISFIINEHLGRSTEGIGSNSENVIPQTAAPPSHLSVSVPQIDEDPGLNPKYTFDTYVVGGSNQFAHAASFAVAEQPSKAYNPLFIYGGVGLGKTHLMHAIGHALKNANIPGFRLYYLSSETFL